MNSVNLFLIALLSLSFLAPVASRAADREDDTYEHCSAELEYLDGTKQTATVECEGPYAGKCLKQAYVGRSLRTEWKEVECK